MNAETSDTRGLRILSLDGGDARCMSQLYLLREFMGRLESRTGQKARICDFFDLIVAVDTASLLAVLVGVFGMEIEDAEQRFAKICRTVFTGDRCTPEERARRLRLEIEALMTSEPYRLSVDAKLKDISFTGSCKVALCYTSAQNSGNCRMFRNYRSRTYSYEPTLIEAISTSLATPERLPAVHIGAEGLQEKVLSAIYAFSNPTEQAIAEAHQLFPNRPVSCLLSLGSGRRGVTSIDDSYHAINGRAAPDTLADGLSKRFERLGVYYRLSVDQGLEDSRIQNIGPGHFGSYIWAYFQKPASNDWSNRFGDIQSHTGDYLARSEPSDRLEGCLTASLARSNILVERLYRSGVREVSLHGLPPSSPFFVMREQPLKELRAAFFGAKGPGQRIVVISGLGGSGKTQLALKFARIHDDIFHRILFVDASSTDSVRHGLAHAMSTKDKHMTYQEVVYLLAQPDGVITENWLVILDNADNPNVNLREYIPVCDHGSILITTRNDHLGCDLDPESHVRIGVMSPDEAVEALFVSIYRSNTSSSNLDGSITSAPTTNDRETANAIVQKLGFLPIAVIQAGCYIRQNRCQYGVYLDQLEATRQRLYLLSRGTPGLREQLKYNLSVYAAFEITASILDPRALRLLGILSFYHFTGIPLPLFELATKAQFSTESFDLLDRDKQEFENTIQFLKDVLCPQGQWQEAELNYLIDELQAHSLVSLVRAYTTTTLRFHPLTLLWAHDRLLSDENLMEVHRAAAIRLLVCGTEPEHVWLADALLPHVEVICKSIDHVHVNDRVGFARIMESCYEYKALLKLTLEIFLIVEAAHGMNHIRTIIAGGWLATGVWWCGDEELAERVFREVIAAAEEVLGEENMQTAESKMIFARLLVGHRWRKGQAEPLITSALRTAIKCCGLGHYRTSQYMRSLATEFLNQEKTSDSKCLFNGAIAISTKLYGRSHSSTISALDGLAAVHRHQGDREKSWELGEETSEYQRKNNRERDPRNPLFNKPLTAENLRYPRPGPEPEAMLRQELEMRRKEDGDTHPSTLEVISRLGSACFEQKRYEEAWKLWRERLETRLQIGRWYHPDIELIYDKYWNVERYNDGKRVLEEALSMQLKSAHAREYTIKRTREYIKRMNTKLAERVMKGEASGANPPTSTSEQNSTVSSKEEKPTPHINDSSSISARPSGISPTTSPLPEDGIPPQSSVSPITPPTSAAAAVRPRVETILVPLILIAASVLLPTLNP